MTILGIITIITGITFLLNAYVFYVRFMQRKENCSKQIVVLVINYKRKTYRSFDNPTPTYFSSHYINSKQGNENIKYNLN